MTATADRVSAHERAVATLRASYAAVPAGQPVRLAKRTSNLFRPRTAEPVTGLDASGLTGVISIDEDARTADVQGMCTYEVLVAATLARGLMPLVVPQLKTITLGGAVTGLGIESTSFRSGLVHESVLELDILTGAGELIPASPTENADLFHAFPNSYGSLGYALRLRIELEPVQPYVGLRHVHFTDLDELCAAIATIRGTRRWVNETVDFLDGVMFAPDDAYLTLGRFCASPADAGVATVSDYTGQQIYYKSLPGHPKDCLSILDYLWRWDTDWFWCSRAFGAQHPIIRRLWPAKHRRSDVYHRIVRFENRYHVAARIDRWRGQPASERVVQDVEVPLERTADFLRWFAPNVAMSPVWVCPIRQRERANPDGSPVWPLYPMRAERDYVNVGFWGTVPIRAGRADGDVNRAVEAAVAEHGGHKSLYSDAYYDQTTFDQIYGGPVYAAAKASYDPQHRLTGMYEKAVGSQMKVADLIAAITDGEPPLRISAYDGSSIGPSGASIELHLANERGLRYLLTAPGEFGMARAYVSGDLSVSGVHPGDPYEALRAFMAWKVRRPPVGEIAGMLRELGWHRLLPPPRPTEEAPPRWQRTLHGLRHSRGRDATAISTHYDVSNAFYEKVLGPSMAYTCAVFVKPDASLEQAQEEKFDLVSRKLGLAPGMRLLDVGCGWGGMAIHAAKHYGVTVVAVTLSREQAAWGQDAVEREGLGDQVRILHSDYRDSPGSDYDAVSSIGLTEHIGVGNYPSYFSYLHGKLRDGGRILNHCITRPTNTENVLPGKFIDRYVFPDGELTGSGRIISKAQNAGFEIRHEENLREHYALTLKGWCANLVENWDFCVAEAGAGRARVWGLYMAGSRLGFETNDVQLHQVLGVKVGASGDSGFALRPTW